MAQNKWSHTLNETDIRSMIRKGELTSEIELERASRAARFLRLQSKSQPELESLEEELGLLIRKYESIHWSGKEPVPDSQIIESDLAEAQADAEFRFFISRRELILSKLKTKGLKQNDLAGILAHNKSYTSELLNGIRAFSTKDLIVIHKLLDIKLEDLFFTQIPHEVEERIKSTLGKISDSKAKSQPRLLEIAAK
ncbi:helix-turn-helix domain-containing protein [Dyadobacter bucti]|uniref:helix-turn-helix domain-containing protein n=1 Tax=Dyadobacter bucti TaxID=2572203 RepID=UPI001109B42C|nr:helix-turn-helix transcriptional regulator [Dyadobacter bucti]